MDSMRLINVISIQNMFGICNTDSSEQVKIVTCEEFLLKPGSKLTVLFSKLNTSAEPKLNVNNSGDKAILFNGKACPAGMLGLNTVREFVYDGENWHLAIAPPVILQGNNSQEPLIQNNTIGTVIWQYTLLENYLTLDGHTLTNVLEDYIDLFTFFQNNNLIAESTEAYNANKAMCFYDEITDELTLPDFINKTIWGGNIIEEKKAGLPNITGRIDSYRFLMTNNNNDLNTANLRGAFYYSNQSIYHNEGTQGVSNSSQFQRIDGVSFDASRSNSIYNNSTTVQPNAIQLIPQIKYK